MKIIFMGTPEIASENLKNLLKNGHKVEAVFTPPDKPQGRGYKLVASPVKQLALEKNLDVFQPKTLKDKESIDLINKINPDLIIVVAYGLLLPKEVLCIPKYGCINIHTSLLPKYRGAAPAQWSIINGEKYAGVTAMFMDEGLDTGDIITSDKILIEPDETSGELLARLTTLSLKTMLKTLDLIETSVKSGENGKVKRTQQNNSEATWAPVLEKNLAYIDFSRPALEVHNMIRGLNPWPVAKVKLNNKILKIYRTKVIEKNINQDILPGMIIDDKKFVVACGENALEFLEVQLEGGKRMETRSFLLGHKIKTGEVLQSAQN